MCSKCATKFLNVPTLSQRLCWVKCIFTSMLQCKLFTTLMSLNLGCLVKFTTPTFPFIKTILFLNNDKNQCNALISNLLFFLVALHNLFEFINNYVICGVLFDLYFII